MYHGGSRPPILFEMATCPRCKGHLTDAHRCPTRPVWIAAQIIAAGLAGGFVGLLLIAWLDPTGRADMDYIAIIAGALIAVGLHRALSRQ
jgi:hypothetical protein